ncbi:hypothetical protein J3R82DRAFT_6785 [Butyriboletus roseoflavus]|nr:hypothetical protein J3R82DRAFT_6785 [Butyriboletus roseoflavus]
MNVAGPSRVPPAGRLAPRGRVESTYEDDLLGLLSQLSLDEMDEMQMFFTHRTRGGDPLSDHDVAMNDLLQQARALAVFDQDRVLAQRIAAGEDPSTGVNQVRTPAGATVPRPNNNGTAAQRNVNQQHGVRAPRNDTMPSQSWGGWLASVVDWAFGSKPVPQPGPTNAGTAAPRTRVVNRPTGHDCVICQDAIHGAEVRAPCGHYYDIGCITDLFQSATRDETLYPPRCCRQNIPFPQVQPHLSQTLITTFQQKQVEFGTLKRVYCSSPTCSRFLGPISEGIFASKVYTCPAPGCARRTCGRCREQHSGDWTHVCRPDADATEVLALSNASGWARCPGCSQMIELHLGCFHMTCRCRTEFCYLCRARWKTCGCPQWDERRLLAVAEERVDAQLGVPRDRGARRDAPAVPARRAPVLVRAPAAPVPPRHPPIPVDNALANRARIAVPAAPPAAPVPPPAPARPPTVPITYPQLTPARTPTVGASGASSSTGHTARSWGQIPAMTPSTLTASTRTPTNRVPATSTSASTSTPATATASSSGQARRPKSVHDIDTMRQHMVREMMDRLRVDHECDHKRWRYRDGGGRCQSCGHHLPLYLFVSGSLWF